jgi:pyrimidine operon attenuation protein/uracil phosphoribosyltransferase
MLDNQVSYMRADKSLDKAFRLVGPTSSSKTVILNTFAAKMHQASHSVSVPMSAYLTLDLFRDRVEDNYRKKRENTLVPLDASKQLLLIIDDVHL